MDIISSLEQGFAHMVDKDCDDPEIQAVIRELNRNLLNNYNNLIKELQNFTAE